MLCFGACFMTPVYLCMFLCACVPLYVCVPLCAFVCMCVSAYLCGCVAVCMCVSAYLCGVWLCGCVAVWLCACVCLRTCVACGVWLCVCVPACVRAQVLQWDHQCYILCDASTTDRRRNLILQQMGTRWSGQRSNVQKHVRQELPVRGKRVRATATFLPAFTPSTLQCCNANTGTGVGT